MLITTAAPDVKNKRKEGRKGGRESEREKRRDGMGEKKEREENIGTNQNTN